MSELYPVTYPSWLTKHQLEEAEALIAIALRACYANGFSYIGNVSEHFDDDEIDFYKCGSYKSWKFCTAAGECFLDAVCQGALYSWHLENHPDFMKPNFVVDRVSEIKKVLKSVNNKESESGYEQLKLF